MDDANELLALAAALARDAGRLLLATLDRAPSGVGTKSSGTDMVSQADRSAEALIVGRLGEARPHDAVIAEEGGGHEGSSDVRWVVDPLDGTTNYLYGYPHFSVSIAVERHGETVAGAVFDPSRDELFTAARGAGARLNGRPAAVADKSDLATALVATGFSYAPEIRARQAEVLATVLPATRDIRRNGSAALDLCWVACGRVDGYYEAPLQPWDLAAGAFIARQAGAVVTPLAGVPGGPGGVVAAGPSLSPALVALLDAARAGSRDGRGG